MLYVYARLLRYVLELFLDLVACRLADVPSLSSVFSTALFECHTSWPRTESMAFLPRMLVPERTVLTEGH